MSFNVISGIDTAFDTFRFKVHGINCFTVPKYLAVSAFRPVNRELFYAYIYMYCHYNLLGLAKNPQHIVRELNIAGYDLEGFEQYVLTQKLGLELLTVSIKGNLRQKICKALDSGFPVLVPTDQGKYFYWESYQQEVRPHLLLVKGYNADTDVFVIHDGVQNNRLNQLLATLGFELGDAYSEFYMPASLLEQAYKSYIEHNSYLRDQIQIIQPKGIPTIKSKRDALIDLVTELESHLDNVPALLAPKFTALEREGTFQTEAEALYINSQQVLAKTLPKLLPDDAAYVSLKRNLEDLGLAAYRAWKQFITAFAVMDRKGYRQVDVLSKLRLNILEVENKFLYLLHEAGQQILLQSNRFISPETSEASVSASSIS